MKAACLVASLAEQKDLSEMKTVELKGGKLAVSKADQKVALKVALKVASMVLLMVAWWAELKVVSMAA